MMTHEHIFAALFIERVESEFAKAFVCIEFVFGKSFVTDKLAHHMVVVESYPHALAELVLLKSFHVI